MDGIFTWLLEQAKNAGPALAPLTVASLTVNLVLWRTLRSEQKGSRKAAETARLTIADMADKITQAMVAEAKALAKLSTKLERNR